MAVAWFVKVADLDSRNYGLLDHVLDLLARLWLLRFLEVSTISDVIETTFDTVGLSLYFMYGSFGVLLQGLESRYQVENVGELFVVN